MSTDHGHTLHDLSLVVEESLRIAATTSPGYRAALRIMGALDLTPRRASVKDIEDKLYALVIEEDHAAEQRQESEQRAYYLGGRYGYLDARAARPDLPHSAAQMGLSGREAELYDTGWHESYDAYMRDLNEPGHHLSVPSLVPGERFAATTTGRTKLDPAGVLFVEAVTETGSVPGWYRVDVIRMIR